MYNDTIRCANKIITDDNLARIFEKMNEDLLENQKICRHETIQNERFEREFQNWTTKSFDGKFRCTVNFYDDTSITFDNYNNFMSIFNSRIDEIKDMSISFSYYYAIQHGKDVNYYSKRIYMNIYEHKMNIEVNLHSQDNKMDSVYQLIKEIILSAPERYDKVIKKKSSITSKITFALGVIPSIVICTLLCFVPAIRQIYSITYILYPIAVILLGFVIGGTIFGGKIDDLYSTIVPNKKYAGYDSTNYKSIYKDDIDDYVNKSEIIIGKNINNIKNRKEIEDLDKKYSKFIPIELIVILVLSLVMILIGNLF
jgi:hypothetical protein